MHDSFARAEAMNHQYTDQGKEKKLGDDWQKDRTASGSLAFMSSKHFQAFRGDVWLTLGEVVERKFRNSKTAYLGKSVSSQE